MNEHEITMINEDITDLTARPQSGGLLESNTDNILYLAEKGSRDGQMRIVFNAERDTVKAFIDSDKAYGERLKLCRTQKGYSQATVICEMRKRGDATIDAPMLSKFENGYCVPNKTTLLKLSEIYGVKPDYIFKGVLSTETEAGEIVDLQAE